MKLDPRKVRFVSPWFHIGMFSSTLRFVGPEKVVHLSETALTIEGNVLKLSFLGMEWVFRRVLAIWSVITIPYSRITTARYVRFPLSRKFAILFILIGLCLIVGPFAFASDVNRVLGLVCFAIPGLSLALLSGLIVACIKPRYVIAFRAKDGRRTMLQFRTTSPKLGKRFIHRLREYRDEAKRFAPSGPRVAREPLVGLPRRVRLVAAGFIVLTATPLSVYGIRTFLPNESNSEPPRQGGPLFRPAGELGNPGGGFLPPTIRKNNPPATPIAFKVATSGPARVPVPGWILRDLTFLPDGQLAVGGLWGTVRVCDLKTGQGMDYALGTSEPRQTTLVSVALDSTTPSGVRGMIISQAEPRLWLVGGANQPSPVGPRDEYALVGAIGPGGQTVAHVNLKSVVTVRNLTTRQDVVRRELNDGLVTRLLFRPDGRQLAVAGEKKLTLINLDPAGGSIEAGESGPFDYSPDGTLLATVSPGNPASIRLRDPATGQSTRELTRTTGKIDWLTFAPGGRVLAGGATTTTDQPHGHVVFWDVERGMVLATLPQDVPGSHAAFSPDGARLAVGRLAEVEVWAVPAAAGGPTGTAPVEEIPPPRPVPVEPIPPPREIKKP